MKVHLIGQNILDVQADACVSSIHPSKDLDLGDLSRYISKQAGSQLQTELETKNAGENLMFGQVVQAGSGFLNEKFDYLLFACLPAWDGMDGKEIATAVYRCCQTASYQQSKSIVFPCLGTGGLGFPEEKSYDSMLEALVIFIFDNPYSSLEMIYVSLYGKSPSCMKQWDYNWADKLQQYNEAILDGRKGIDFIGVMGSSSSGRNRHDLPRGHRKDPDPDNHFYSYRPSKPGKKAFKKESSSGALIPARRTTNVSTPVAGPREDSVPVSGWYPLPSLPPASADLGLVKFGAKQSSNIRMLNDGAELDLSLKLNLSSPWLAKIFSFFQK